MRNFRSNKRGIVLAGVIAIIFIVLSSIVWLCGALIVNRTFDGLAGIIAECDPRVLALSQGVLNAYAVSIIVVDVLLLVWWGLSAQKKEVVDEPAGYY
jgi:hypothetical protein